MSTVKKTTPVKLDKELYDCIEIGLVLIDDDGQHAIEHIDEADDGKVQYCLFGHLKEGGRDELQMDFDEEGDAIEMASILARHWNMNFWCNY